ncbi:CLUMA_CG005195, isoform A [Clunio marinus]|uniref:CLUMA_CG005195, isoform A n=1 Tax=Clunio marinus TaxID=568069 RepID=A0A1J1HTY9_9DIPT|nr:CLUMA_CG005195, isoform A [Clunio marinus]
MNCYSLVQCTGYSIHVMFNEQLKEQHFEHSSQENNIYEFFKVLDGKYFVMPKTFCRMFSMVKDDLFALSLLRRRDESRKQVSWL